LSTYVCYTASLNCEIEPAEPGSRQQPHRREREPFLNYEDSQSGAAALSYVIPSSEPKPFLSAEPFLSGSILPAPTNDNSKVQQAYKAIADLCYNRYGPMSSNPSFHLNKMAVFNILTLRIMAKTHIHLTIAENLAKAIDRELDRLIITYPALLSYNRICCISYISLNGHIQVPFLIEVSYRQHLNDLRQKVQHYFGYLLDVQTILCIDITAPQPIKLRYQPSYTYATRTILWTIKRIPGRKKRIVTVSDTQFCWADGRIISDTLTIPFQHFLPLQQRDSSPDQDQAVSILYTRLVEILQKGEWRDRNKIQRTELGYELIEFD
ncbi:hypothetical protein EV127DRAFT_417863, partial [Xylaria flabelliformis]